MVISTLLCLGLIRDPLFLRGGDVSEIPEVEASGATYAYQGKRMDPFVIMKKAGWNFVRFRVWNDPKDGWCDKSHTLALAKRAKAQGLNISLDFHYSDWWADPGHQPKPKAWKDLPFEALTKAVHDYTQDVVGAMVKQGTPPIMVQVGNEISGGLIWPDGKLESNAPEPWRRVAKLIQAGIDGVHDIKAKAEIATMIHLDRGADNAGARWWFDHLKAEGVDFDLIGLSYYPFWHGSLENLQNNLNDLATRYGKDVYVVELGYPWKVDKTPGPRVYNGEKTEPDYPATPEGQAALIRKVLTILGEVPEGKGKGLLYWAPTWIAPKGKHGDYSNLALFDEEGNALPSVDAIGEP
ncbi:hypothetical protein BH11ARM2_BH11ARM2_36250 [soil metagenome]